SLATFPDEEPIENLSLLDGVIERVVRVLVRRAKGRWKVGSTRVADSNAGLLLVDRFHIEGARETERRLADEAHEIPVQEHPVEDDRISNEHRVRTFSYVGNPSRGRNHGLPRVCSNT